MDTNDIAPRLLIIPGLNDSGPAHWQTWLQQLHGPRARRVVQRDFSRPDLERWADRIAHVVEDGGGRWIAVAHSFGVLALARHLHAHPDSPIREALLVAPASPDKFGIAELLPQQRLPVPSMLLASENDPWMSLVQARLWAGRWGSHLSNLGRVGHVNTESGFGPFPLAQRWAVAALARAGQPSFSPSSAGRPVHARSPAPALRSAPPA